MDVEARLAREISLLADKEAFFGRRAIELERSHPDDRWETLVRLLADWARGVGAPKRIERLLAEALPRGGRRVEYACRLAALELGTRTGQVPPEGISRALVECGLLDSRDLLRDGACLSASRGTLDLLWGVQEE